MIIESHSPSATDGGNGQCGVDDMGGAKTIVGRELRGRPVGMDGYRACA
jgi:hypothetical protein